MATRTVSHLALCCLIAAIVLTNATTQAAPADKTVGELMLSDLSATPHGTVRLDLNANGGPLKLRTATGSTTYTKGIGMKVAGPQPDFWVAKPPGCTGFAALIGADFAATTADTTTAGFELYEWQAGANTHYKDFGQRTRTQVQFAVTYALAASTDTVSIAVRGNGLVDWANARFTGCPVATPTPTATRTPTVTPTATATPPATATSLPTSTATPVPSGFTHGIFEEGNLDVYNDPEAFRATLLDIKARGFRALIVTNGNLGRNNGFLTVADQVGGIKVYLGAPELMPPTHEVYTLSDATQIAATVSNQFKTHASFAGYYLQDEPADDYADDLALLAQAFRTADPAHDVFITNNAIDSRISTFSPQWMRPLVIDPYPFVLGQAACDLTTPTGPAAGFAYAPFIDELISRSGKPASMPFLMIGQAFSGGEWRAPSAEEIRAQYRVSREKGAAGMFWFIWSSVPSEGLVGLKDRPLLLAEVTAIAQGTSGGPSCDGSVTPTPVSTIAATSTATLPPTATQPPTPTTGPTGNGVPSVPLNYAENVDQFWARHPANSSATGYVANLGNPGAVVNVNPSTIQAALNGACASSPCTLLLADGSYGEIHLIGRSHIHFRGVNRSGARIKSATVVNCAGEIDAGGGGNGSYTAMNEGLANNDATAWACFTNRGGDISFKNLTFDGQQTAVEWNDVDHRVNGAALWIRSLVGVWIEDVDVTGYRDGSSVHDGAIGGNIRVDNLLLRRVHFESALDHGPSTYAFFDGCHGCAILDSETGFSRAGAFTFFVNDDFTEDINRDGQWSQDELRLSNYLVMRGNVIHGEQQSHAFAVQGAHALIENNTTEQWSTDFALFQTRQPFNHPAGTYTYHHVGHIVRNNQIHGSFSYTRFDAPDICDSAPNLPPDQCWYVGDLTVTGNHMTAKDRLWTALLWTAGNVFPSEFRPWPTGYGQHPPITVSGNT